MYVMYVCVHARIHVFAGVYVRASCIRICLYTVPMYMYTYVYLHVYIDVQFVTMYMPRLGHDLGCST